MWTYLFLALALTLSFIYLSDRSRAIRRNGVRLPRPKGTLPFAGFGLWFLQPKHRLLDWLAQLQPGFGLRTYELAIPTLPPAILVNDPEVLEFILKNHEIFIKGKLFRKASWDLFGNGILNVDGELWKIQRKAGLRFFTNSNMEHFIDDVLTPMIASLHIRLEEAAKHKTVIDLQDELLEVTTGLMGKVAYDMHLSTDMSFSKAFEYVSGVTADRFTNPLWWVSELFIGRKFKSSVNEVKSLGSSIVQKALERRKRDTVVTNGPTKNLIDSFLDHIADPHIVAEAATNFLSAGRDTTAQVMTWTIYELLRNPTALTQVRESLTSELANSTSSDIPLLYNHISQPHAFPAIQAAFAEGLRLHPAVPIEIKETIQAITLPDGTNLPYGGVIVWIPFCMSRSPNIWGPDAGSFNINRWLERNINGGYQVLTRSAYENPVFNAGPRMCIGKRMAELSAVKILTELLWYWDIEEVRGKGEIKGRRVLAESLTSPMQGGLPVRVRRLRSIV